jgi:predicted permease
VLTESIRLAVIGGAIGMLAAPLQTRLLISYYPGELPRAAEIGMNWRVVAAAVGGTALAALLASIPAMRRAGGHDLASGLREGNRDGLSRGRRRVAGTIVATQIAASLVLFFIAGLVVQTFITMNKVQPGFDPNGVIAFQVVPTGARHRGLEGIDAYYRRAVEAMRRLPGVSEVASMTHVPFFPSWFGDVFVREDKGDQGAKNPQTSVTAASPGFERALRLRVVAGRTFARSDDSLAPRVVMINRALAGSAFAGEDPVGKTIYWNGKDHWTIIGIVDDARDRSLIEAAPPMLYVGIPQNPRRGRYLVVRGAGAAEDLGPAIRRVMREIDPTVPLNEMRTLEEGMSRAAAAYRFRAWLMASLGALACVLAIVGIYGVVSDSVARRTRDIGIRMALGQDAGAVRRDILQSVLRLAAAGVALGVLASFAAGRSVAGMLYGVEARDPLMLLSSVVVVLAVAIVAALIPARRASRIDPMVALRAE